jgi:Uma2 family endonuclease
LQSARLESNAKKLPEAIQNMTIATSRRMSLTEFLTYDSDRRYELVDGVLVDMGAESRINTRIVVFLIGIFSRLLGDDNIGVREKIEVRSTFVTARDADLIIHSDASILALDGRTEACLTLSDPNPNALIEVVSPGTESTDNYKRDYIQKPIEYADRGIREMWQVDPSRNYVRIGTLIDGAYQFKTFQDNEPLVSPAFPDLNLTASQVLRKVAPSA